MQEISVARRGLNTVACATMAKPSMHLPTLDGLRGIAALAVLFFHVSYYWHRNLLPHAYLAVDFFFMLSGFVIARAYEERLLNGLGFFSFLRLRLIRLYPLIFCGMILGFADDLLKLRTSGYHAEAILSATRDLAYGLALSPQLATPANQTFPLDPPAWSLFYEIIANLSYALFIRHLTNRRIGVIVALASAMLIYIGFTTGHTGDGALGGEESAGLARVGFAFFLGVLLFRLDREQHFTRLPHISSLGLGLSLVLIAAVPAFPGDWIYNLLNIVLVFPLIVLLGAAPSSLTPRLVPTALWLGRISYPLYVLHFPLLVRNSYHLFHNRHGLALALITIMACGGTVLLSWLALVLYDEPLRRYLAGRHAPSSRPIPTPASPSR